MQPSGYKAFYLAAPAAHASSVMVPCHSLHRAWAKVSVQARLHTVLGGTKGNKLLSDRRKEYHEERRWPESEGFVMSVCYCSNERRPTESCELSINSDKD